MQEKNRGKQMASTALRPAPLIAALVAVVLLLVFAVLAFVNIGNGTFVLFSKIVSGVLGVLLLTLIVQIAMLLLPDKKAVPNFFLIDRKSGSRLEASALTYETVSVSMDHFFSKVVQNKGQLWLPGSLEKCDFGAKGQFRPIAAYKMLIDLADADTEGGWRCFCACPPATVEWIARSLAPFEGAMMRDVQIVKARFSEDPSKIRGLVMRNAPYLKRRAVAFVAEHLDDFKGIR